MRRSWFTPPEAVEIKALIDELHDGDEKAVRARLRTDYGFYVGDHVLDASRMTRGDFDDLVHRGRIRIVEAPERGVEVLTAEDESFWAAEDGAFGVRDRDGARCWFPERRGVQRLARDREASSRRPSAGS